MINFHSLSCSIVTSSCFYCFLQEHRFQLGTVLNIFFPRYGYIVFFNVSCLACSDIGGIQIITYYSILLDCKAFVKSEYWTSKGIVKHMIHWPVLSFLTRSIDDIDASTLRAFLPTPKYNCFAVHIRCNNFKTNYNGLKG